MRGSYHKERRASSAGVSRSKIAAEARKKKLAESSSTSETLKSVFAESGSLDGLGLARKWSRQDAADGPVGEAEDPSLPTGLADGVLPEEEEGEIDGKNGMKSKSNGKMGNIRSGKSSAAVDVSGVFDDEYILDNISSSHVDDRKEGVTLLLDVIRNGMTAEVRDCILGSMLDSLKGALVRSINRLHSEEQKDEATLMMHLVCLLGLLVGPDEDDFFKSFEVPLKKIVECSSVGDQVQSLALLTLSFISYICSNDTLIGTLEFLEDLIENGPHEITDLPYLQACKSWVLLCGALEEEKYILRRARSGIFGSVSSILENSLDIEGRIVSGLCLAYLYEVAADFHRDVQNGPLGRSSTLQRNEASLEEVQTIIENGKLRMANISATSNAVGDGSSSSAYIKGRAASREKGDDSLHDGFDSDEEEDREADYRILEAAMKVSKEAIEEDPSVAIGKILSENDGLVVRTLTTLRGIAKESSKKMSKKDKKEQRAVFRDIESLIFDMNLPKEKVRFSGATVEVSSIQSLTFLESLRTILGNGFQRGLRSFPVLCDIFNIQQLSLLDEEASKSKGAKVSKGSKEDKRRSKHRREGQKAKN